MQIWHELAGKLIAEKGIFSTRVDPEKLAKMFQEDNAIVRFNEGRIIGFIGLWKMDRKNWFEIGSVWVDPRFRGKGMISEMFDEALKRRRKRNIACVVNGSKSIIHLLIKNNFSEVDMFSPGRGMIGRAEKTILGRCLEKNVVPRLFFSYA